MPIDPPPLWDADNEPLPGLGGRPTGKEPSNHCGESDLRAPMVWESTASKVASAGRPSPELQDLHDTAVVLLHDHWSLFGQDEHDWLRVVECPCDVWYYKRNK